MQAINALIVTTPDMNIRFKESTHPHICSEM